MSFDLDQPLKGAPVAVFDLETTGSARSDRICEVGVAVFERFFEAPPELAYCTLVDPEIEDPWQGTIAHKLRAHHVRGAPLWISVWPVLQGILSRCLVVAYNASFDLRFLRQEAEDTCSLLPVPPEEQVLDPLAIVRRLDVAPKGRSKGYHTLSAACERRQLPVGGHRAGPDAMATSRLLHRLIIDLYRGEGRRLCPPPQPTVRQFLQWVKGPAKGESAPLLSPVAQPLLEAAVPPAAREGARLSWAVVRQKEGGQMYLADGRGTDGSYRFTIHVKNARRFATESEAAETARSVLAHEPPPKIDRGPVEVVAVRLEHLVGAS